MNFKQWYAINETTSESDLTNAIDKVKSYLDPSDDANAITGRIIEASGRYARRISSEHAALPAAAAAAPAAEPAACRLSASCAAGRDRGRRLLCPI